MLAGFLVTFLLLKKFDCSIEDFFGLFLSLEVEFIWSIKN
jgi:hypothetical protein